MAGMRMGYGISTERLAGYIRKYYRGFHLNSLQLAAGLAALDDPQQVAKNVNAGISGREYFYEQFDRLDVGPGPVLISVDAAF